MYLYYARVNSCHRFRSNEVRLWLSLIAYNLGNLWRRLVLPARIDGWRRDPPQHGSKEPAREMALRKQQPVFDNSRGRSCLRKRPGCVRGSH